MFKKPFDEKLDCWGGRVPSNVVGASTWTNDTMELAFASARQVFGEDVSHEIAIKVYDRIIERIKHEDSNS